jgi:hypothetical protein
MVGCADRDHPRHQRLWRDHLPSRLVVLNTDSDPGRADGYAFPIVSQWGSPEL